MYWQFVAPTDALFSPIQFVASALKQPGLEFKLICPAVPKPRVVPHFPKPGEQARTLQEEDLVPSALLKFKPKETDSVMFTGLLDELLQASEPLPAASWWTVYELLQAKLIGGPLTPIIRK
jgi:UBX domain-containing protein 6